MSSNKRGSKRRASVVASGDSGRRRGADGSFISTPVQVGNIDPASTISNSSNSSSSTDTTHNNSSSSSTTTNVPNVTSSSSTSGVSAGTSDVTTSSDTIPSLGSSLVPLPQGTAGNRISIHDDSDDESKYNGITTPFNNNSRSNHFSSGGSNNNNSEGNKLLHQIWHIRLVPDHAPKLGGTSAAEFNELILTKNQTRERRKRK